MNIPENLNLIMLCISGSHAYNLNIEGSDKDVCGIALEDQKHYIGTTNFHKYMSKKEDVVVYGFKEFVKLLTHASPNIVELMGVSDKYITVTSDIYRELKANIQLFLSKKVYYTYSGYATSELTKFVLGDKKDYKKAMHSIRLLKMGIEILKDGVVLTERPDRMFLLDIRNGKYSESDILEFSAMLEEQLRDVWANTKLPDIPNFKEIEKLQMRIIREHLFC